MTIQSSELLVYKSKVITDDNLNGGRMSSNQAVSGVVNNIWPSVFKAERDAGSVKYRKTFFKCANDDDDTLFYPQLSLDVVTPAEDWICFFAGTQIDTQADIVLTSTKYGCGTLNANVVSGTDTVVVNVEDASLASGNDAIYRVGDKVRITNKDTPDAIPGTEEIMEIQTVTPSGAQVTLQFTTNLANDYNTDDNLYGTRITSIYEPGDLSTSVDDYVVTTAGDGTYDDSGHPIKGDNIGSIEQTVTLTFTSATDFTAASNVAGVTLAAGSTGSVYAPDNPDFSKPYFTIPTGGFQGTWTSGDTLEFKAHPAAIPIWQKRTIPAGAASLTGNRSAIAFTGESA